MAKKRLTTLKKDGILYKLSHGGQEKYSFSSKKIKIFWKKFEKMLDKSVMVWYYKQAHCGEPWSALVCGPGKRRLKME